MPTRFLLIAAAGAVLSACASAPADATRELHGVVLDQATHRPVAGATVRIKEFPQVVARTADDGTFTIPALPRWQGIATPTALPAYNLQVDAPGYRRGVQAWDAGDWHAQVVTLRRPGVDDEPQPDF